jgi:hypothetical protein
MLAFPDKNLVYLAIPKTASTSIEALLAHAGDQNLSQDAFPKHITARQFFTKWSKLHAPQGFPLEAFAVIRDPVDRLGSWYRYRQRPALRGSPKSTENMTFESFVNAYIREDRPAFADIGNQFRFCTNAQGDMLVRFLFSFEDLSWLETFVQNRFGITEHIGHLNSSQKVPLDLSQRTRARLEQVNAAEFELYESVASPGWREFDTSKVI